MRKKLFVLVLAGAAVAGAAVLAPDWKGRVCPQHYKKLRCASGRIVCCEPGMLCDCGSGFASRPAGEVD
jgi:hypothetical protein